MAEPTSHVRGALERAGITPPEPEVLALEAFYEHMRAQADRLWDIDVGDTPPALILRAAEWTGPAEVDTQ